MFEDLIKAYRDLVDGPRTPSSLDNKYSDIPYTFLATILLIDLEYISNTIIDYIKYNYITIIAKKERFLNNINK